MMDQHLCKRVHGSSSSQGGSTPAVLFVGKKFVYAIGSSLHELHDLGTTFMTFFAQVKLIEHALDEGMNKGNMQVYMDLISEDRFVFIEFGKI